MGCRVNQQLDLLNTLQSYMLLSQTPRCGGHRRSQMTQMPPSTNTMNPVVVSYLATSRLGSLPSAFEAFSQVKTCWCWLVLACSDVELNWHAQMLVCIGMPKCRVYWHTQILMCVQCFATTAPAHLAALEHMLLHASSQVQPCSPL